MFSRANQSYTGHRACPWREGSGQPRQSSGARLSSVAGRVWGPRIAPAPHTLLSPMWKPGVFSFSKGSCQFAATLMQHRERWKSENIDREASQSGFSRRFLRLGARFERAPPMIQAVYGATERTDNPHPSRLKHLQNGAELMRGVSAPRQGAPGVLLCGGAPQ